MAQTLAIPSGFGRSRIRRNCGYTLLANVFISIFSPIKIQFSERNFVKFHESVVLENNFGFLMYDANTVAIRIRITISAGFPLYI